MKKTIEVVEVETEHADGSDQRPSGVASTQASLTHRKVGKEGRYVVDDTGEINTLRWCKRRVVEQNGVEEERRELEGEVVRTNGEIKILGEKTSRGGCTGCYCICVVVISEVELLAARSDSPYSIKPPQAYSTTCPFQPCIEC